MLRISGQQTAVGETVFGEVTSQVQTENDWLTDWLNDWLTSQPIRQVSYLQDNIGLVIQGIPYALWQPPQLTTGHKSQISSTHIFL